MRKFFLIGILALIAISYTHAQDRWKLISESTSGVKFYYDSKTIVQSKEITRDWHTAVEVWIKTVDAGGSESMFLYEINCDNGKYSIYDKENKMLEFDILPPPESIGELIVDVFCRRK